MIPTFQQIRLLINLIVYCGVCASFILCALLLSIVSTFKGDAAFPVDCAIVFGAAVHGVGEAGPGITRRVQTAAELYREDNVRKIFLTGGKGSIGKESEAAVMRKVALLSGIDPKDVILEEQAKSTIENITFTRPLTQDCQTVVGVSDRYHLARIDWIARQKNWPQLQVYPAFKIAPLPFEIRSLLREVGAFLYSAIYLGL